MARVIEPTPTLKGLDAKRFVEKLEEKSTSEETKSFKRVKEIFKKIKFVE